VTIHARVPAWMVLDCTMHVYSAVHLPQCTN
jgi:hypothetical protein